MYKIQSNPSGTRSIEVSEEHLQTLEQYNLLQDLVDSNGIVDETVLEKLKLNMRSIIHSQDTPDKNLVGLCIDVIFHDNMKAFGLHQLIMLFINWRETKKKAEAEEPTAE